MKSGEQLERSMLMPAICFDTDQKKMDYWSNGEIDTQVCDKASLVKYQ
jgi:hypothetical protein